MPRALRRGLPCGQATPVSSASMPGRRVLAYPTQSRPVTDRVRSSAPARRRIADSVLEAYQAPVTCMAPIFTIRCAFQLERGLNSSACPGDPILRHQRGADPEQHGWSSTHLPAPRSPPKTVPGISHDRCGGRLPVSTTIFAFTQKWARRTLLAAEAAKSRWHLQGSARGEQV